MVANGGLAGRGAGCRKAVHRLPGGLGGFVLCAPALPFGDGGEYDPGVELGVGAGVGPHEPGMAVGGEHISGESFDLRGDDARFGEGFPDDGSAVGAVPGQGFAGPLPGDEDAPTAEPEVLPIVGFRAAPARPHPRTSASGLDAVAEPIRTTRCARQEPQLVRGAGQCDTPARHWQHRGRRRFPRRIW